MDKIPHLYEFFQDLMEGNDHCVMVGLPKFAELTEFVKNIPDDIVFKLGNRDFGKEHKPHITVLYGIKPIEEEKAKKILSKIPGKLVATLDEISLFEDCKSDDGEKFDVLKIDVKSPHLAKVNEKLRKSVEYENKHDYHPHVTLAYLKPGKGKEFVGDKRFKGKKFLFEVFLYSNGSRDEHDNIPMLKEYAVGTGGGYGGHAGGAVTPTGWAGTYSSPSTSGRLDKYQDNRRTSYMQGNTVVNNSLYDTIRPEDLKHPKFKPDDIEAGLKWEMKRMEYPDKTRAKPIVLKNLEKDPHYYSDLAMYHMDGKY